MEVTTSNEGKKAFDGWNFDAVTEAEALIEFGKLCGRGFFFIKDHLCEGFRSKLEEGSMIE